MGASDMLIALFHGAMGSKWGPITQPWFVIKEFSSPYLEDTCRISINYRSMAKHLLNLIVGSYALGVSPGHINSTLPVHPYCRRCLAMITARVNGA